MKAQQKIESAVGISVPLEFQCRWNFSAVGISVPLEFQCRWTFSAVGISVPLDFEGSQSKFLAVVGLIILSVHVR